MATNDTLLLPRRRSIRLRGYDYARAGGYVITLCTEDRSNWFGEIVSGEMILNDFGLIVAEEWARTTRLRPNVVLDEYVVMPNHLHGIIFIADHNRRQAASPLADNMRRGVLHTPAVLLEDQEPRPLSREGSTYLPSSRHRHDDGRMQYAPTNAATDVGRSERMTQPGERNVVLQSPSQTVGAIIRGFKAASTKRVRVACGVTGVRLWQRNYYEHVIRNDADLDRLRAYIANNPARWDQDKNNPEASP